MRRFYRVTARKVGRDCENCRERLREKSGETARKVGKKLSYPLIPQEKSRESARKVGRHCEKKSGETARIVGRDCEKCRKTVFISPDTARKVGGDCKKSRE